MKKSIYNLAVHKGDNYLLFNCYSLACVLLTKQEYMAFESSSCGEPQRSELLRLGFYVDDDVSEVDAVCYDSRLLTDGDKQQFYRVYTTLACNARCPYCYEAGSAPISMTQETADALIKFIKERMVRNTKLTIEWFGGEPLLNKKIIRYITKSLDGECAKKRVKFVSSMITNGYLFDEQTIKEAKDDWHLDRVQITLDGRKETYERIKGFGRKDSFERVIGNIDKLLANKIAVNIRLNYNQDNMEEIKKLIAFLGQRFASKKGVTIYARRIMGDDLDNSFTASAKTDIELLKGMRKSGFYKDTLASINRRNNTCVANMLHSFMVTPDGRIGKCSQAMSKNDFVGDVFEGVTNIKLAKWCSPRLEEKCLKCKLLPLCNGGCIYEKLQNKNFCFASKKMIEFKLKEALNEQLK